jgi:outer membrane murein-binding lipoprotein Lpp
MGLLQVEAQAGMIGQASTELQQLAEERQTLRARAAQLSSQEEEVRSRAAAAAQKEAELAAEGAR